MFKTKFLLIFLMLQSYSAQAEIIAGYPSEFVVKFTRGQELIASDKEFFAKSESLPCSENAEPVTTYIQVRKGVSNRPVFLTISQLCPGSKTLETLRQIRDGEISPNQHIVLDRVAEPLVDPTELSAKGALRVRTPAESRVADKKALLDIRAKAQESIDRHQEQMRALEELSKGILRMHEYYNPKVMN